MNKLIIVGVVMASLISKNAISEEKQRGDILPALAIATIGAAIGAPAVLPIFASYVVLGQMIIGGHEPAPRYKLHTRSGR